MISAGQIIFRGSGQIKDKAAPAQQSARELTKPLAWEVSGHLFDNGFTEHRSHSKTHPKQTPGSTHREMLFPLPWIHPIRKHLLSFPSGSKPKIRVAGEM